METGFSRGSLLYMLTWGNVAEAFMVMSWCFTGHTPGETNIAVALNTFITPFILAFEIRNGIYQPEYMNHILILFKGLICVVWMLAKPFKMGNTTSK